MSRTGDTSPPAPGSSPFRIKGSGYIDTIEYLEANTPGGIARVLEFVREPELRAFAGQRFLPGSWYDALPIAAVFAAGALANGLTHTEMCRRVGRYAAGRALTGVHRFLLKLTSPEGLMLRFPKTSKLYFDFVDLEIVPRGPRTYEFVQRGVPTSVVLVYQYVVEAFRSGALEGAGAKNLKTRWSPAEGDGERHGIPVSLLRCEVSWS